MSEKPKEDILDIFETETTKREVQFMNSSILNWARYDKLMQTLTISFKMTPGHYSYFNVPSEIANNLFALAHEGSAGKYFIKHIKNNFPFKRIT